MIRALFKRKGTAADAQRSLHELAPALIGYFARGGVEPSEREDLVQEVFARILQRGELTHYSSFRGYVFDTARSVLHDRHRKRTVRYANWHVPFEPDLHSGVDAGPEETILAREAIRSAAAALDELPARTRSVFILRRLEGLSYADIGDRLGISVSAIEKHMQLAARHLTSRARMP
jgi:RNA polymerase sigma-70 factor (ECF subfamily)